MATWPLGLPQKPEVRGYAEVLDNSTISSPAGMGTSSLRPRYSQVPTKFTMQLILDSGQVDTLLAFFSSTLSGGALSFTWIHPRTELAKTFRFFEGKPPSIKSISPVTYSASFQLEVV